MQTSKQNAEEISADENRQQHSFSRQFLTRAALYCGGAGLLGFYGVPALFSMFGLTAVGPTAASTAAAFQASGVLPSVFSLLQSWSATNAIGLTAANVGAGAGVVKAYYDAKKTKQNEMENDKKPQLRSKL